MCVLNGDRNLDSFPSISYQRLERLADMGSDPIAGEVGPVQPCGDGSLNDNGGSTIEHKWRRTTWLAAFYLLTTDILGPP